MRLTLVETWTAQAVKVDVSVPTKSEMIQFYLHRKSRSMLSIASDYLRHNMSDHHEPLMCKSKGGTPRVGFHTHRVRLKDSLSCNSSTLLEALAGNG